MSGTNLNGIPKGRSKGRLEETQDIPKKLQATFKQRLTKLGERSTKELNGSVNTASSLPFD